MKYFIIIIILCLSILFLCWILSTIILIRNIFIEIDEFYTNIDKLKNNYISYSKYKELKEKYNDLYIDSKKINLFKKIKYFINNYELLHNKIKELNDKYVEEEIAKNENYFDTIFKYKLDIEQRKAIVTDDDYNLIIAGAGSGKTSTIIGKVKYLIDKKNVLPESIIVISFSNKTVENFQEKLSEIGIYNIECLTFHKLGKNNILKYDGKIAENLLEKIIIKYLDEIIVNNNKQLQSIVELFGLYIHISNPVDFENLGEMYDYEYGFDLETMKNKYNNYINREKDLYTLQQEKVKSYEELVIANYLFLNGINYEYEKKYVFDENYNPDFYLTDYDIYLEHFGINENGRCPQLSEWNERDYLEKIKWKRALHKQKNTKLLESYSYYFKEGTIIQKLESMLKSAGVKFNKVDYNKVYEAAIKNNQMEEYKSFRDLINKFINMFKGNNYAAEKMSEFYQDAIKKNNVRNQILLSIISQIYLLYEDTLLKENQLDFNDLINRATKYVNQYGFDNNLDYIIVDEFQDTSQSRFLLLKSIIDKTKAKLVVVGDDWQSIYRFTGCDLDLFINFNKYVECPQNIFINDTHRNSQELINVAGNFIMKNELGQISKKLKSNIHDDIPIRIYYYNKDKVNALNMAIKYLNGIGCKNIAILGRNNSDNPDIKYENINFHTVHKSKGLEFDGTIIVDMKNSIAGFPNKMSDDPILDYVSVSENDYLYEEERRLFYVALTRTKGKCCILVPLYKQSMFIDEILKDNSNQIHITMCEDDRNLTNYNCPVCKKGKLVVRTNHNNSRTFLGCTNYPKCDYKVRSKDMGILKNKIVCPNCGHFLVKRDGKYGEFYGCSNYPKCNMTYDIDELEKIQ